MEITIENYTEHCLKTWSGPNQKERAELGIIGELGEVAEVLKKHLRGDFDEAERDKRLLKELGDVWYYIAIFSHLDDLTDEFIWHFDEFNFGQNQHYYRKCELPELIRRTVMVINEPSWDILDILIEIGCRFNFKPLQIMQANVEKLQCRAKRNVIKGDGDER